MTEVFAKMIMGCAKSLKSVVWTSNNTLLAEDGYYDLYIEDQGSLSIRIIFLGQNKKGLKF